MFRKYRWNFVFVVLIVSVIGFLFLDILLYYNIKNYLFQKTFEEMRLKTNLAVQLYDASTFFNESGSKTYREEFTMNLRKIVNSRVTIIDSFGVVLNDSDIPADSIQYMENHLHRPEVQDALKKGWGQSYRNSPTIKRRFFYTAVCIKNDSRILGFLRFAYYGQRFEESLDQIVTYILAASVIGLISLFFAAYYFGSLVTIPITRIVDIARKISSGDLERTFPVTDRDEIGTLALILNQLTERLKNQISQISTERSKLKSILMNLDLGIIAVDSDKNILNINPEMYNILKINSDVIDHKNIAKLIRSEVLLDSVTKTLEQNSKETGEIIYFHFNDKKYLSYIITPFYSDNDKKSGALIQIQDITPLKQLEAIRRTFVANASHELKTPLTAIVGYTETLLDNPEIPQDSQVRFVRRIREQTQRLEFLVADLLKLSRLEHEFQLNWQRINFLPFVNDILEDFSEQLEYKSIRVQVDLHDPNVTIWGDFELLRSVFTNLIDNAIKYTPSDGKIFVRTHVLNEDEIRVEIKDTGIGIDPKYHERIFQRFYRVDKARSRALGGTGLGLSIVKHILERHASSIYVQSQINKGSSFFFNLKRV